MLFKDKNFIKEMSDKIDGVASNLEHRIGLGGASIEQQAKRLNSFLNQDVDDAWDDAFITGVTDSGRERVREHLENHIRKMVSQNDAYRPNVDEVVSIRDDLANMRECTDLMTGDVFIQ